MSLINGRRLKRSVALFVLSIFFLPQLSSSMIIGANPATNAPKSQASQASQDSPAPPAPNAQQLFELMLQAHDPQNKWPSAELAMLIEENRPNGELRKRKLWIDNSRAFVAWETSKVRAQVEGDKTYGWLEGKAKFSDSMAEKYRLTEPQILRMRDYYHYMYGIPMKWKDPGTIIQDQVVRQNFSDQDCWRLTITYDPEIGSDIWFAWIDPQTYRLVGTAFEHELGAGDGEWIELVDYILIDQILLPQQRHWYVTATEELLGTDTIIGPIIKSP